MVITIDGPAGSGKSTVARKLASRLGFIHLNSGALFRAVGLIAQERGVLLDDDRAVSELAKSLHFEFRLRPNGTTTFIVDNVDHGERLTAEDVGKLASQVALLPTLRQVLLELQRDVAKRSSVVVEGRDSGTVVFPDAEKKFYLDASPDVRAARKLTELAAREQLEDETAAFQLLRKQMEDRDRQDATRELAPHRRADDAVVIDTSPLSPDQVVEKLASAVGA
ncbi:MAG: (d)CMP kinase [Bdellovibrionota bacterium]